MSRVSTILCSWNDRTLLSKQPRWLFHFKKNALLPFFLPIQRNSATRPAPKDALNTFAVPLFILLTRRYALLRPVRPEKPFYLLFLLPLVLLNMARGPLVPFTVSFDRLSLVEIDIVELVTDVLGLPSKVSDGYIRFLCPQCSEFNTAASASTNLARSGLPPRNSGYRIVST